MSMCPCCSNTLLRHIYRQQMIWFCSACRQEMPNFDLYKKINLDRPIITRRGQNLGLKEKCFPN